MPKIQYPSNLKIKSIQYNLYLDNLLATGRNYSSDVLARCPNLSPK